MGRTPFKYPLLNEVELTSSYKALSQKWETVTGRIYNIVVYDNLRLSGMRSLKKLNLSVITD